MHAIQRREITPGGAGSGLGGAIDEYFLLIAVEANTLTCAPLIAWNALYGIESKAVKAGDWTLTQGGGGVNVTAIQFAFAAGATVVATTSSNDKLDAPKKLGASHVISYRETPNWGDAARAWTSKRPISPLD